MILGTKKQAYSQTQDKATRTKEKKGKVNLSHQPLTENKVLHLDIKSLEMQVPGGIDT